MPAKDNLQVADRISVQVTSDKPKRPRCPKCKWEAVPDWNHQGGWICSNKTCRELITSISRQPLRQ